MPWIRNQAGRQKFVSDQQYKSMINNKDEITIIPNPTLKDPTKVDPKSTDGEQNIVKLRAEFKAKFGDDVPTNKKNDAAWIASKVLD